MESSSEPSASHGPPAQGQSSLWGVRFAVSLIVLSNLLAFAVIEGGYSHGKSIFKFSTLGAFYLVAIAILLFRRLRRSPADGLLVGIGLSLVGASANLSSHVDSVEVVGAIAAMVLGPLACLVYGWLLLHEGDPGKRA